MFEMFLEGQTDRKGGCQDPGISREKNNSFSSFLVSVVVHLTWENEKKKPKLRTFICMLLSRTDCRILTQKEIFPYKSSSQDLYILVILFSSIGHGS